MQWSVYFINKNLNLLFYGPISHSRAVIPMCLLFVVKLLELLFAVDVSFQRHPKILKTTRTNFGKFSCQLTRVKATFSTISFLFNLKRITHLMRCRPTALLLGQAPGNFYSLMLRCFLSLPEMLDDQGRASVHIWVFARELCQGFWGFYLSWHIGPCGLTTFTMLPFQFSVTSICYLLQLLNKEEKIVKLWARLHAVGTIKSKTPEQGYFSGLCSSKLIRMRYFVVFV